MGGSSSVPANVDKKDLEKVCCTCVWAVFGHLNCMMQSAVVLTPMGVSTMADRKVDCGTKNQSSHGLVSACLALLTFSSVVQVEELKLVSNFTDKEVARLIKVRTVQRAGLSYACTCVLCWCAVFQVCRIKRSRTHHRADFQRSRH